MDSSAGVPALLGGASRTISAPATATSMAAGGGGGGALSGGTTRTLVPYGEEELHVLELTLATSCRLTLDVLFGLMEAPLPPSPSSCWLPLMHASTLCPSPAP